MAELNQTDYGDHEPAGGQNGPIFTADDPPHGHDVDAPQEFDVGPAIMNAGATAYNEVIESGGTHEGAMEAMGGACSEAAAELGVPVEEFNQAMEGFTEGFNTAQMEGGDAQTCINSGFDSADQAVTDGGGDGAGHDYHPPADVAITNPPEFPDPGEGMINPAPPVDLPEDMSHNWEEGTPPPEHPCNCHEEGDAYGPGPELGVMTAEVDGMGSGYTGEGDGGGDAIPTIGMPGFEEGGPNVNEVDMAGEGKPEGEGPEMTGPPAYEGGPPTVNVGTDSMGDASEAMDTADSAAVSETMSEVQDTIADQSVADGGGDVQDHGTHSDGQGDDDGGVAG